MKNSAQVYLCEMDIINWRNKENRTEIYDNNYISYGYNYRHLCGISRKITQIRRPSLTLTLVESYVSSTNTRGYGAALSWRVGGNPWAYPRHGKSGNALFCDGHAESVNSSNGTADGMYSLSALGDKNTANNRWTADGNPAPSE